MEQDIVTRLREKYSGQLPICLEAADEIERLRNKLAEQTIIHEVQKTNTLNEIELLRRCLQHAIDHVGKWGLFTAEEKQAVLAEYEQAVRGD